MAVVTPNDELSPIVWPLSDASSFNSIGCQSVPYRTSKRFVVRSIGGASLPVALIVQPPGPRDRSTSSRPIWAPLTKMMKLARPAAGSDATCVMAATSRRPAIQ